MSKEVRTIKPSIRNIQVVGTLSEINMCIEEKEIEIKGKKVKCNAVVKKEFKNPSMNIEVNGDIVDVDFINTYELNKEGEHNSNYDGMVTIMKDYVTKIKATDENPATRVKFDGMINLNEYATEKGDFSSRLQLLGFFPCTSTNVPEEDLADGKLSGIIRTIKPEMNKDEEETGRLIVEICSLDKDGAILPYKVFVEEDMASDFSDLYEQGCNTILDVEVLSKHVGAKKQVKTGGFGRRESKAVSGYSITELSVFGGTDPLEEENELFIDLDTVKTAMKERDIMIEAKINEKKNGKKDSKPQGLKGRETKAQPSVSDSEDDCPF